MIGYNFINSIKTTDVITVAYMLVTALFIVVFGGVSGIFFTPLMIRVFIILFVIAVIYFHSQWDKNWINFIHLFYPILLLSYFYGETALINNLIFSEYLDPIIYNWEQTLFGFQPSLEFSIRFPQPWFSELLYMGYFSYYLLTFGVSLMFFIIKPTMAENVNFLIITSLFIYYLIFIIFPVVGPQYYFSPPFSEVANSGFFSRMVKLIQHYGEHPTGAFPSSHVGLVVIFLTMTYNNLRWLFWVIVPLFLLILLATVYIKAHYAIDIFAGLLSAPIVYYISGILFRLIKPKLSFMSVDSYNSIYNRKSKTQIG